MVDSKFFLSSVILLAESFVVIVESFDISSAVVVELLLHEMAVANKRATGKALLIFILF